MTKIDVILLDSTGNRQFQIANYSMPTVLYQTEDKFLHIQNALQTYDPTYYYHYRNTFGLEYLGARIKHNEFEQWTLIVGPFISRLSIIDFVKEVFVINNLPISERKQLEQFYQSLPVLHESETKNLGNLLIHLCSHPFTEGKPISKTEIEPVIPQKRMKARIEENKQIIEERYRQQNLLMDAVTKGDKQQTNRLMAILDDIMVFSDRVPESPIRSAKNIAFVINTLFRIAAERSGVHPVYLHNISERFAISIERITTLPGLKKLIALIGDEYCELVNHFATGHYSPIIKKAVDYISLNLGNHLSLKEVAAAIHVNASHLSRKFKEETGLTMTEFIHEKRIAEAKLYLQREDISITDVAFMVGFNDLNYFSKVFKKLTSLTPSQYIKKFRGKLE